MSVSPSTDNTPWGFLEWIVAALSTLLASVGAFIWRLMLRLESIEAATMHHGEDIDAIKRDGEIALLRLVDRVDQIRADHYRLREAIVALPTRTDLRDLDEHLGERIDALTARLDRALET